MSDIQPGEKIELERGMLVKVTERHPDTAIILSIAISAKRIADNLMRIADAAQRSAI